eukprot:6868521-Prorocentrum_lima.AAC.1
MLEQLHSSFGTVRPRCHGAQSEEPDTMEGVPLLNLRFCKVLVTNTGPRVHHELVLARQKCPDRLDCRPLSL